MENSIEQITRSNLLIYNSRIDLLDFIMENMMSKQEPVNIKIAVVDNTLNKYEKYNQNPYMLISIVKDIKKTLGLLRLARYGNKIPR